MERTKLFTEPDLVILSQGLVSVSTATTVDSVSIKDAYDRNAHHIEQYRVAPREDVEAKIFTISWQNYPCGQIILQIDKATNSALVSYWVDSQLSNRNIATTATRLLREHAFDALKLDYLEAYVQRENKKSIRVLEKSEFVKTESLYKAKTPVNDSVLHLIYKTYPDTL